MNEKIKIINDCFWDYNITINDIDNIIKSNNLKEMLFLFEKIIVNSQKDFDYQYFFKVQRSSISFEIIVDSKDFKRLKVEIYL